MRSIGINGYVGKQKQYGRRHKKGFKKRYRKIKRFNNKVENALQGLLQESAQYVTVQPYQIASLANKQNHAVICIENSYPDLNSIWGRIKGSVSGQYAPTAYSQTFMITGASQEITMKNNAQTNAIVDIYEVIPRNDTATPPQVAFQSGMGDQNLSSGDLIPGVSPFESNQYCSLYKILRKTRYLLAPGATEIIMSRNKRKKKIDVERLVNNDVSGVGYYRNWTKLWHAVVRGEPTNDTSTKTTVGTSIAEIDFIITEVYRYTYAANNMVLSYAYNNQGTVTTASSILESTGAVTSPPANA